MEAPARGGPGRQVPQPPDLQDRLGGAVDAGRDAAVWLSRWWMVMRSPVRGTRNQGRWRMTGSSTDEPALVGQLQDDLGP